MLSSCEDPSEWDAFVSQAKDGSILQSWGWAELKSHFGWGASRYLWMDGRGGRGAISVLRRALPGRLALFYAPRGPVLDGNPALLSTFWNELRPVLSSQGGTVLKVDPEWSMEGERQALLDIGAMPSRHPVQHQATWIVDIRGGDEAFRRLKESTRRNIREGERRGVVVEMSEASAAMDHFYSLLNETSSRRSFPIRAREYYQQLLDVFRARGQIGVYLARLEGRLLAGAVMMFYGNRLVYLFGGTTNEAMQLKPGYLLHWRAIQDAQRRGCTTYDMWGIPLEPKPDHPGYGYYTFKSRFNGSAVKFIGLYDLPVNRAAAITIRLAERFARAGEPEFV